MPREPAAASGSGIARLEVDVVVDDEQTSGGTLKKRAAAPTDWPDTFMYVSGFSSASLRSPSRTSASCPENFERKEPSCLW